MTFLRGNDGTKIGTWQIFLHFSQYTLTVQTACDNLNL